MDHVGRQVVRVLLITHDLNIGGLQRVVVDLARNLDPARYKPSVCALREGGAFERELQAAGIPVCIFLTKPGQVDYFTFWKIRQLIRQVKPDIVHTHNTQPFIEGALAAVLGGRPALVHTDHGRQFPDKRRYMLMEWFASKVASAVISVSDENKAGLVQYEHIAASLIQVVSNGIDEKKYAIRIDADRKRLSLGCGPMARPILGWCGRMVPEKGLPVLIKALPQLVGKFPRLLVLLAGDGPMRQELEAIAASEGISAHINFLGARTDVAEILQAMDLFVLPSLREGLPLVILEAMAAGIPVVATDVGGNRQAVVDGQTGFLVPSDNPDALAAAISQLLQDEAMHRRFSEEARRRFAEQFTVSRMVERYQTIYEDCLARRGWAG